MSESAALAGFTGKWRARWPEWTIAESFLARDQRETAVAWFALLQELADAAWGGDEPAPGLAKLAWWQEELRGWSRQARRHPLGSALQPMDAPWSELAAALSTLRDARDWPASDPGAAMARLAPFASAVIQVESKLFGGPAAAVESVAAALLSDPAALPGNEAAHGWVADAAAGGGGTRPRRLLRRWSAPVRSHRWAVRRGNPVRSGARCGGAGAPRGTERCAAVRRACTPPLTMRTPPDAARALPKHPPLQPLPDVAADPVALARPLDWVGMDRIALPVRILTAGGETIRCAASVDVAVDLADAGARGIHMSRLYLQLQEGLSGESITPGGLRRLLQGFIESQRGASTRARLRIGYDHLLRRRALASENSGWKRYPLVVDALLADAHLDLALTFSVDYSSTCPASAALSRQLNAQRFSQDFAAARPLSTAVVHDWLASERGLAATPHAQRSRADVRVGLKPAFDELPATALIDAVEDALGTPVQTAVKREDEQAFAERNAANLMFCEDAARRVAAALSVDPHVVRYDATVSHFESLHAHDAVARVSGVNA